MQTQLRPAVRRVPVRRVDLYPRQPRWPRAVEFGLFFAAAALRFLYYGFRYFPQLDDYIQYDKYAQFAPLGEMIERLGLLSSRPIAGVADIAVWSHFWGAGMIAACLLLSALWTASALLFRRVFDGEFGCGALFCVLYLLLPFNFEGTYWISASTRVVCGMFFAALALRLFSVWLTRGRWPWLVGFSAVQLISFGFYEQTLALSGAAVLGLMLLHLRRHPRRALGGLLTLVNLAIYFLFTLANSGGPLAARMSLILPWHEGYFSVFLPELFRQTGDAFAGGGVILARGFARSLRILADDGRWWYLVLFAALAGGIGLFCLTPAGANGRAVRRVSSSAAAVGFALLLVLAALSPFFVVGNTWFSLRSAVPLTAGLALLGELALRACFGRLARTARRAAALTACLLVLVCGVASVSELHDYRRTYADDQRILAALAEKLDGAEGRIGVLNLEKSYLPGQNFAFHEHIHGVSESNWAIQGALWAMTEQVPDVYPLAVADQPFYLAWNRELKRLGGFDSLWWWNHETGELIPLTAEGSDAEGWTVFFPDGTPAGRVREENGVGYFSA